MQLSTGAFRMGIIFFMEDAYSTAAKKLKLEIASLHSSMGILKTVGAYAVTAFRGGLGMLMGLGILLYPFLESIKAAQQFDMFEATYQTLLKSKEKGTEFVNYMRDFALITPFQTLDYVKGNLAMTQHGVSMEDMKDYTRLFSNMTVLTQSSKGTYERLATVMGKIYAEGEIISGRRMNQLGVYGFSLLHDSKKVLGWDAAKEYSPGNVGGRRMTFKEAIKVMKYTESSQTVNGKTLTEQIGATAWGKYTNLGEYMNKIMVGIGRDLMGSYLPALDNLVAVLDVINELVGSEFGKGILVGLSNILINVSLATVAFTLFWGTISIVTFALSALRTIITGMTVVFYSFRIALVATNSFIIASAAGTSLAASATGAWAAAIAAVEALTFWEVALAVAVMIPILMLVGYHMKNAFGDNVLDKVKTLTIAIGQVWESANSTTDTFSISDKINDKINSLGIRGGLEAIVGIILIIKNFFSGLSEGYKIATVMAFILIDGLSSLGFDTGLTLSSTFTVMKVVGVILGFLVGTVIGIIIVVVQLLYTLFSLLFKAIAWLIGKIENIFGFFQWGSEGTSLKTAPITSNSEYSKQLKSSEYQTPEQKGVAGRDNIRVVSPIVNNAIHLDGDEISHKVAPRSNEIHREMNFRKGF